MFFSVFLFNGNPSKWLPSCVRRKLNRIEKITSLSGTIWPWNIEIPITFETSPVTVLKWKKNIYFLNTCGCDILANYLRKYLQWSVQNYPITNLRKAALTNIFKFLVTDRACKMKWFSLSSKGLFRFLSWKLNFPKILGYKIFLSLRNW